ncbi:hypothetical protein [Streptomyces niveus]|uniref:hypothetical protein n=1 Tax=Streptomyces niveus TaxID=193462 RepID=UPI002E304761|nr:hypothetical protein [Streptomyces niveus]
MEGADRSPGSVGDFFGLEIADGGGGAEEEAEVEVLVSGLTLGGVGVDGVTTWCGMPVSSASSRPAACRSVSSEGSR